MLESRKLFFDSHFKNMSPKPNEKQSSIEEIPACIDGGSCHWMIAPPNGPTSVGKCKKCGNEKIFRNSFEYNTWHGEKPVVNKNNPKNKGKTEQASDKSSK